MQSSVHIPSAAAPGRLVADLSLDPTDLRIAVDKLLLALQEAKNRPPVAAPTPDLSSLSLDTYVGATRMTTPATVIPAPTAALPPAQWQAAAAAAAPAAAEATGPAWDLRWQTDAADHMGDPIASMAYTPAVTGLPGGDGHAGWLFTASRGLLQLWECSRGGSHEEPGLTMMHSQAIDYFPVCMEVERGSAALLAGCLGRGGDEWVALHSLDVQALLSVKAKAPLPHHPSLKRPGQNCHAVVSLHPFGGPLAFHCAASYAGHIVVWGMGSAARPIAALQQPTAAWKAHSHPITALHRASFGLQLYSGATDGNIHLWSMNVKPTAPLSIFRHSSGKSVGGVHQVNDVTLISAAADGRLAVWDVRKAAKPVATTVPDGKPITHMAVSAFGDTVAVATTHGLFAIDLLDEEYQASPVTRGPLPAAVTQLTWNAATGEMVAGAADGCVRVYRQRSPYS